MTKRAATTKTHSKSFSGLPQGLAFPAALCSALFFYVWLRIEPAVEHHATGPFFFLSKTFSGPYFSRPGGPVEYAAVFLGHLGHFDWLGALVFAGLGFLLYLASREALRQAAGRSAILPSTALILLWLLLRNRYGSPALSTGLGLLIGFAAVLLWPACGRLQLGLRLLGCMVMAPVLFYLGGVWPCALFGLLAGLAEARGGGGWRQGAFVLLLALAPCAVFAGFGDASLSSLIAPWTSRDTLALVVSVHAVLPLAAAVLRLPHTAPAPQAPAHKHAGASHSPGGKSAPATPWYLGESMALVLLLAAAAAVVWFTFDEKTRARAKIDYLASRGDDAGVLALASSLSSIDLSSQIRLHYSLYQTGILSSNLFAYFYPSLPNLLPGILGGLPTCRAQTKTLFELGLVSDAEHLAHEALEHEGNRPDLLRVLAQINVLKGRPKAARVFLNVLNQVPFERDWAAVRLRDLESNPAMPGDPAVTRIRPFLLTTDLPHSGLPTQALLTRLMMTNPRNQMAFEYLLCTYLLDLNLTNALGALSFLKDLGYQTIPRHLEEALLLHQHLTGGLVDLYGYQVSAATRRRFEQFRDLLGRLPDQSPQSRQALRWEFGDTYWFYFVVSEAASKNPGG